MGLLDGALHMRIAKLFFKANVSLVVAIVSASLTMPVCFAVDAFTRARQVYSTGDYKNAEPLFSAIARAGNENSPSAMYFDALCFQYLGNRARATQVFKQTCDRYPDSAACIRSQTALASLDPAYLKRWKISHPPVTESREMHSIDINTTAQVSPNFTFGTRHVTKQEADALRARLASGRPLDALVSSIPIAVQQTAQPNSYIGLNQLQTAGITTKVRVNQIYPAEVIIDRVKVSNHPFRVRQTITGPVQLGKDFADSFDYVMGMSDPDYARRWQNALAHNQKLETIANKSVSDNTTGGSGGGSSGGAATEHFEIGYQADNKNNAYITVYVDNSSMQMMFGAAGVTTMSPDQLRSISASYVPPDSELMSETTVPGVQIRSSGTATVGSIRFGKVYKTNCTVKIEAYSSPRYQAPVSFNQNPPRLGSDVYADWTYEKDEEHHLLKFTRTVPK
jgi:hypothetical protein